MAQQFSVLTLVAILAAVAALVSSQSYQSDYRKYLRTRPPQAPGEVHVEEVLEVFRTPKRPPTYGVYNAQVNAFLANSVLQRRKVLTTRSVASTTTSTTSTVRPISVTRTTFPTPTRDNENPDYTNPFQPSISMTKYPSYKVPKTIIIQEGLTGRDNGGMVEGQTLTTEKMPDEEEQLGVDETYSYSNEEYFEQ